jgi:hypothetical protein
VISANVAYSIILFSAMVLLMTFLISKQYNKQPEELDKRPRGGHLTMSGASGVYCPECTRELSEEKDYTQERIIVKHIYKCYTCKNEYKPWLINLISGEITELDYLTFWLTAGIKDSGSLEEAAEFASRFWRESHSSLNYSDPGGNCHGES